MWTASHLFRIVAGVAAVVALPVSLRPAAVQDTVVPQTAFSTCAALSLESQETVAAGTGLAVSPDGRWFALYIHTNRGGEVTLRPRAGGESHRVELVPPALPPGVAWRVLDAVFSPGAELLAIRTTGAVWVVDVVTGHIRYHIGLDPERQTYPGKLSLAADTLAVIFWPPESYLAEARAKGGIDVRLYDAATGRLRRTLSLELESSDAWTDLELSPDATRVAFLRRATRWPGKARLAVFETETGKPVWQDKLSAEDFLWSADGRSVLALGSRLTWLEADTGKQLRESKTDAGSSEYHKLRVNEAAKLAVAQFSRYSRWKRSINLNDRRDSMLVLWRLEGGGPVCRCALPASQSAEAWLTSQGQIITLEENYDLRPQLRLLKSARIVTYKLASK